MPLFSSLYARTMQWSRHPHAPAYLAGLSFAESSFFPIPPDVMLAPMSMAQPNQAWFFAGLTTLASVIGGMLGYLIGVYAFDLVQPWLHSLGYWEGYLNTKAWFGEWGFWAIFLAGFSPIPYKIFTITAGVIGMAFLPFVVASIIGRGARFFLVAALMAWGGARMEKVLHRYVDRLGWILVIAFLVLIIYLK
ncbi:MAG: YqaA family protein [Candidatus Thiodiazotropha endolucinida]|uniref:SNARE associated golgi protein n=2 Tax=Candidatus Thiodiazotropha TaxID=1913444 RepID=A0A7Z1AEP1_9GAMM|nr:YqaA family protein [Candidatus Thiodiazotropha endolucinida]MBT3010322.1 DedA family protein [Candidatus Thiodiazotropha sp. (ex Lucina pensylvanica)]MBT3014302.1 DedA family protein [Candidatus Thiodiazotropha taylori]MBT3038000.1 DedA family protein [Candidatus Thiodiazotropha sp. (ex Codakia orbicularis)]MBV2102401.1 DedA family protein [Candidatus Thiodiazotropha sp. (ex Lucina aurantia)]MBT3021840.1 DedA family protein [Candidatus Thiodiazotropha taylori]